MDRAANRVDDRRAIAVYSLIGSTAMIAGRAFLRSHRRWAGTFCVATGSAAFAASALRAASLLRGPAALRERILAMIDPYDDLRVLAIGPTAMPLALAALARSPHARLTALAFEAPLPVCHDTRIVTLVGDPRRFDFPDASFDAIVSVRGLRALRGRDRDALCAEIARVLAPGGTVVLAEDRRTRRDASQLTRAGLVVEFSAPLIRESLAAVRAVAGLKPIDAR